MLLRPIYVHTMLRLDKLGLARSLVSSLPVHYVRHPPHPTLRHEGRQVFHKDFLALRVKRCHLSFNRRTDVWRLRATTVQRTNERTKK